MSASSATICHLHPKWQKVVAVTVTVRSSVAPRKTNSPRKMRLSLQQISLCSRDFEGKYATSREHSQVTIACGCYPGNGGKKNELCLGHFRTIKGGKLRHQICMLSGQSMTPHPGASRHGHSLMPPRGLTWMQDQYTTKPHINVKGLVCFSVDGQGILLELAKLSLMSQSWKSFVLLFNQLRMSKGMKNWLK